MTCRKTLYIFRLWARAKGYVPLFAHWEEADNPEQTLPAEFTFRLKRGTVIGGIVRDPDGKPIQGVTVEVMLSTRGGEAKAAPAPTCGWPKAATAARTDAEGRWTLDNVPPGDDVELQLKFSHPDYISDPDWGTLARGTGRDLQGPPDPHGDDHDARRPLGDRDGHRSEGKPVAGAVVVRGEHPYWEWGSQEVRTDEHGIYRLPPLPAGR